MESGVKVMIVEDNPHLAEAILIYMEDKEPVKIAAVARNAYEAIEKLEQCCPRIVLLDLVMPHGDGFVFLEYLNRASESQQRPHVIVLSAVSNESIIRRACELGADYYLVKPFTMATLYDRVEQLLKEQAVAQGGFDPEYALAIEQKIKNAFILAGVSVTFKGTHYLCEAVKMAILHPECIYQMTKGVYPELGRKFHTTAGNVERAIRHVIESSWESGVLLRFNDVLRANAFEFPQKPSNSKLIALFARHFE